MKPLISTPNQLWWLIQKFCATSNTYKGVCQKHPEGGGVVQFRTTFCRNPPPIFWSSISHPNFSVSHLLLNFFGLPSPPPFFSKKFWPPIKKTRPSKQKIGVLCLHPPISEPICLHSLKISWKAGYFCIWCNLYRRSNATRQWEEDSEKRARLN